MVFYRIGSVGKSALTYSFKNNTFFEDYDPTIEDYYQKTIMVDDQFCRLEIIDTAGQNEYSPMMLIVQMNICWFTVLIISFLLKK